MRTATIEATAQLIGGIRAAHPHLSATTVEALLWIAAGVDSVAELRRHMGPDVSKPAIQRSCQMLCGRGVAGARPVTSRLRLVDRRRHPNSGGFQLALSDNGRELIAATFKRDHQCKQG
jgi:hypothetical protein